MYRKPSLHLNRMRDHRAEMKLFQYEEFEPSIPSTIVLLDDRVAQAREHVRPPGPSLRTDTECSDWAGVKVEPEAFRRQAGRSERESGIQESATERFSVVL
jgi:hypothetical protein